MLTTQDRYDLKLLKVKPELTEEEGVLLGHLMLKELKHATWGQNSDEYAEDLYEDTTGLPFIIEVRTCQSSKNVFIVVKRDNQSILIDIDHRPLNVPFLTTNENDLLHAFIADNHDLIKQYWYTNIWSIDFYNYLNKVHETSSRNNKSVPTNCR